MPDLYSILVPGILPALGFATALLIGLLLGMLGAGGAILTLPVFIFFFGIEPVEATSYSLVIVAITGLGGVISHARKGNVRAEALLRFGIPSVASAWTVRKWVLPAIPDTLIQTGSFQLSKDDFILVLFGATMVLASLKMIAGTPPAKTTSASSHRHKALPVFGLVSGALTSLVGAGGGFIIIPILHLYAGLSMPVAVGTSLSIILLNSLVSVIADLSNEAQFSIWLIIGFSAFSLIGVIIGSAMVGKINADKLRKAFGWFVLLMGALIVLMRLRP